mgnify:FL=1
MKRHAKRIIYDIAGLFLVILSPFLGAIPGPGGLLVFFAGLSILAIHNDWAKQLLVWAKQNMTSLVDIVFADTRLMKSINDCIGIVLLCITILLALSLSAPLKYGAPVATGCLGIFWLLRNRHRYKHFIKH